MMTTKVLRVPSSYMNKKNVRVNSYHPKSYVDLQNAKVDLKYAIQDALKTCDDTSEYGKECVIAWETVEEISKAIADRTYAYDPLESYCNDHPSDFECKVYDV